MMEKEVSKPLQGDLPISEDVCWWSDDVYEKIEHYKGCSVGALVKIVEDDWPLDSHLALSELFDRDTKKAIEVTKKILATDGYDEITKQHVRKVHGYKLK
jgi:hypothetical protein